MCVLCLRLQRGSSVRGWGLTAWGRGARSGGARAEGVHVAYPPLAGTHPATAAGWGGVGLHVNPGPHLWLAAALAWLSAQVPLPIPVLLVGAALQGGVLLERYVKDDVELARLATGGGPPYDLVPEDESKALGGFTECAGIDE